LLAVLLDLGMAIRCLVNRRSGLAILAEGGLVPTLAGRLLSLAGRLLSLAGRLLRLVPLWLRVAWRVAVALPPLTVGNVPIVARDLAWWVPILKIRLGCRDVLVGPSLL
jgi:hypothetical protein